MSNILTTSRQGNDTLTAVSQQTTWHKPQGTHAGDSLEYIDWDNPFRQALRYVQMSLRDSSVISVAIEELTVLHEDSTPTLDEGKLSTIFHLLFAPIKNAFFKAKKQSSFIGLLDCAAMIAHMAIVLFPHILLVQIPLRFFAAAFEKLERLCEEYLIKNSLLILKVLGYIGKFVGFGVKQLFHASANMLSDLLHSIEASALGFYSLLKTGLQLIELAIQYPFINNFSDKFDTIIYSFLLETMLMQAAIIRLAPRFMITAGIFAAFIFASATTLGAAPILTVLIEAAILSAKSALLFTLIGGIFSATNQLIHHGLDKVCQYFQPKLLSNTNNDNALVETSQVTAVVVPDSKPRQSTTYVDLYRQLSLNHYQFLGIEPDSKDEQIRKALRDAQKKYHPDKNLNEANKKNTSLFLRATEAGRVLRDPVLRVQYDRRLIKPR